MNKQQLIQRKDFLVEQNRRLLSELSELDSLMRLAGFSGGLETVKLTAQELAKFRDLEEDEEEEYEDEFYDEDVA